MSLNKKQLTRLENNLMTERDKYEDHIRAYNDCIYIIQLSNIIKNSNAVRRLKELNRIYDRPSDNIKIPPEIEPKLEIANQKLKEVRTQLAKMRSEIRASRITSLKS